MRKRSVQQKPKRAAKNRRARGRPSLFKSAVVDEICARLAEGETLRAICSDDAMPAKTTVMRWLAHHSEFRDQYARAREAQADAIADQVIEIADDGAGDVTVDKDGKERVDWENVNRSRLRVDARRWFAAKIAPKRYGERIAQEFSGPGGGPIATTEVPSAAMPPAEVAIAVRKLLERAERELGLASKIPGGVPARVKRILASGRALPPELYAALVAARKVTDGDS